MLRIFVVIALYVVAAALPAEAAKRVALIIGNAAYKDVGQLANPLADANAVAQAFTTAGFDDVRHTDDLSAEQMRKELKDFSARAEGSEIAVVYYAGHGIEVANENYLIPVDAKLLRSSDVEFEAIPLASVRSAVSGASILRMVILDACRNNPFKLASSNGKRAATRGLSSIEPGTGEVVAYSAKEGTLAQDGPNNANSPFAASLVKNLKVPGLEIRLLFGKVRDEVQASTNNEQTPYTYASLGGDAIYLTPPKPVLQSLVAQDWQAVSSSNNRTVLQAFLSKYADDAVYTALAKEKLALLVLVVPPTPKVTRNIFRDCPQCPEMVEVPAGKFRMGSPANQQGREPEEGPVHGVAFKQPLAVGKYEITIGEYAAFVSATDHAQGASCALWDGKTWIIRKGFGFTNPGFAQTDKQPATCISWNDAQAYIKWLSQQSGKSYRLLTEAEWEYAGRAGSESLYGVSANLTHNLANFETGSTSKTGQFPANRFGLFDMQGNVWEWTQDCYVDNYTTASPTGKATVIPDCQRTYRGGAWANPQKDQRPATRGHNFPDMHADIIGFRVAREM